MKLVCFDLDGTVLDPGGSIRHALNAAVQSGGFPSFAHEEILIGMPLRDILRLKTDDPDSIESMVEEFRRTHMDHSWKLAHYHEGFPDVIQSVRNSGFATAIVTTKGEREAIQLMKELGITDLWDVIIGDNDVRALKPHPAPVLAACERVGVAPEQTVMIGDTSYDMDAGRAAGTWTIGVSWGNGPQWGAGPEGGHVVVDTAEQLLAEIHSWADATLE